MAASADSASSRARPARAARDAATALLAGIVAAVLDITFVFVYYHSASPLRILKGIAAGLVGRGAYDGGLAMEALGLGLHVLIATSAAAVYTVASRVVRVLARHPIPSGLVYGIGVWFFMNVIVLPHSATPPKSFPPPGWPPIVFAHLFCVGLPIALIVSRRARSSLQ